MADVITVSALNKYVRSILESDPVLTDVAIRGEISNFNRNYKSGHCYFSLKDANSSVKAVLFRSHAQQLAFLPENGMQVVVRGRITLYERDGAFQIYAEYLFPDGEGAVQMAFEQLKERLGKEGLFDAEYKQPLPVWPLRIGLVTSKTGAALQDILRVAQRRCPLANFLLAPVTVQGNEAAGGIAAAIRRLDAHTEVDLIIVARGGGSAEDLWVFNAEEIVRAVFACQTPVLSAVGHETDVTILDYVADMRAPTPSAAAEMALPDLQDEMRRMRILCKNIRNNMQFQMETWYNMLQRQQGGLAANSPGARVEEQAARLRAAARALRQEAARRLGDAEAKMQVAIALAAGLNPYGVLARGYGVVKDANGHVLHAAGEVQKGQDVDVLLNDGTLLCHVKEIRLEQVELINEKE